MRRENMSERAKKAQDNPVTLSLCAQARKCETKGKRQENVAAHRDSTVEDCLAVAQANISESVSVDEKLFLNLHQLEGKRSTRKLTVSFSQ